MCAFSSAWPKVTQILSRGAPKCVPKINVGNYKTRQNHGADTWPVDLDRCKKISCYALAMYKVTLMSYFIYDYSNLLLGPSQRKKLQDNGLPGLSRSLRHPLCSPALFSPRPGHVPCHSLKTYFSLEIFTSSSSISSWPSLRDPAQFGLWAASGHSSFLRATPCHCTDFSPGQNWDFPSFTPTSFYFMFSLPVAWYFGSG